MGTNNTSIATVNASNELYGVDVGETNVEGDYDYVEWSNDGMDCYRNYGNGSDTAPVAVVGKPDHLQIGNDIITSNSTTCGAIRRLIDYVVVDNHTPARSVPSVLLIEDPASGITDSCNNNAVIRTSSCSAVVDASGVFEDDLFTSCPGSGSCGFDIAHNKWQWCNGASHVTLADLNYSVHHDQVKVNGRATAYDSGTSFH